VDLENKSIVQLCKKSNRQIKRSISDTDDGNDVYRNVLKLFLFISPTQVSKSIWIDRNGRLRIQLYAFCYEKWIENTLGMLNWKLQVWLDCCCVL